MVMGVGVGRLDHLKLFIQFYNIKFIWHTQHTQPSFSFFWLLPIAFLLKQKEKDRDVTSTVAELSAIDRL
jgi:hypothetical protein